MPAKTKVMIDINLLPPDLAPKRFVKLNNIIIAFLIILISISLFGPLWKLRTEVKGYADMIEIKDQQIKEYQKESERIHDLRSKVKLLKTRLSVVQELLQEKSTWSDKLVELYECIPNYGVWMDMLTIEYKNNQRQTPGVETVSTGAKEIMVYISGTVTSVDKVSEFLASLEDSETFGNVVFDSVSSSQVAPGVSVPSSISFRIGVQILVPGEIMQKPPGRTGQRPSI